MPFHVIAEKNIIEAYKNGQSMNAIAKTFNTYATTIKRILEKNNVTLRHDNKKKGQLYIKDGEKLIEWAKAQGRLVTQKELAEVIGRKKLSPSYFIKYPELGQYVEIYEQKELAEYTQKLHKWLKENNILYKPNDRTKLGVSVDALLLGEYEGLALQVSIKPTYVSKKVHEKKILKKFYKGATVGIHVIFLDEEQFKNLDTLKAKLDECKKH